MHGTVQFKETNLCDLKKGMKRKKNVGGRFGRALVILCIPRMFKFTCKTTPKHKARVKFALSRGVHSRGQQSQHARIAHGGGARRTGYVRQQQVAARAVMSSWSRQECSMTSHFLQQEEISWTTTWGSKFKPRRQPLSEIEANVWSWSIKFRYNLVVIIILVVFLTQPISNLISEIVI